MSRFTPHALPELACITLRGSDARSFLQGQLSNDLTQLSSERALLASCNSAQGRVQGVMTLLEQGGDIVAVVPGSMLATLIKRLKFYVLRAKVTLEDSSHTLRLAHAMPPSDHHWPATPGATRMIDGVQIMRWWSADARWLAVVPATQELAMDSPSWQRLNIAAGIAQVYPETHEHFVAQMLNLDVLGGISFNKGCYTGQEIIARTHFRGTVKRRLLRFHATGTAPAPGTRIVNGAQPAGEVADVVNVEDGCEVLAVMSLEQLPAQQGGQLQFDEPAARVLTPLPLPYAIG